MENGPQLIIQIIYALLSSTDSISISVFLAFIGSALSVIMAVSSYYANKTNGKDAKFVSYSINFVNTAKNNNNSTKESLKNKKERKQSLQKAMAHEFGISPESLEIGYSKNVSNGLEMRIVQFISGSKLKTVSDGYDIILQPMQYVTRMYDDHREEINVVFRNHFDVDQDSFVVTLVGPEKVPRHIQQNYVQPQYTINPPINQPKISMIYKDMKAMMTHFDINDDKKEEEEGFKIIYDEKEDGQHLEMATRNTSKHPTVPRPVTHQTAAVQNSDHGHGITVRGVREDINDMKIQQNEMFEILRNIQSVISYDNTGTAKINTKNKKYLDKLKSASSSALNKIKTMSQNKENDNVQNLTHLLDDALLIIDDLGDIQQSSENKK